MTCTCGHPGDAHQHYRVGTDCALCDCKRLRANIFSNADGFWSTMGVALVLVLIAIIVAVILMSWYR